MKFLSDMISSNCCYIRSIASLSENEELSAMAAFYNVDVPCLVKNCREISLKCVEESVGVIG